MTSLVIQTAFLGDVVLTTPLLEALAARDGAVDVVTTPAAATLVETHPAVRRVIPYDKRGAERGLTGFVRLVRTVRAGRYDVAYLPHRSLRSAALAWLARIPRRIGFEDGWRSLYTESRGRPTQGHEIDRLLALGDIPAPHGARPSLHITVADRVATEGFFRAQGIHEPFIALAPGSIWGSKRWAYYPELAQRLVASVAIVVVGSPEDRALGDEVVQAVEAGATPGRAVNACGSLTLRQSAEAIRRSKALVTNDSAPLHLAQAVETPTVAIFGSTVPAFGFGPRGPRDQVVELTGLSCRPCSRHGPPVCPLGHHRCMRDVGVERVLAAIAATGALGPGAGAAGVAGAA